MNNTKIKFEEDLVLFHQASKIPFCVFDNSPKDLLRYPLLDAMECSPKTLLQCSETLRKIQNTCHIPLIYSSVSCFAALIKLDENTNVMFGPVSSIPLTYKEFYDTNKSNCDPDDLTHLYQLLRQSPHMNLTQFANNISLFIKLAFQEVISPQEILANHVTFPTINTHAVTTDTSEHPYITITEAMFFQKKILFHIQNGNMREIENMFGNTHFFSNLTDAPSSIKELQKIFFCYAIICCVAVIEEGVDLQKAFPIFDSYICRIPMLTSSKNLEELCMQLSIDYCQQTVNLHDSLSSSPVVTKCLQYIQNNIHAKITINDLARHCNLSKRTISRHFSEYHHSSVSEYILQIKLKEASFLLIHSGFSLAEISNQLAFSSQSHFTVAFKKKYYYTPQQYREKFKK